MLRRWAWVLLLCTPALAEPFLISSGKVTNVQVSGSSDGTTHAVWVEAAGGYQAVLSATFDLNGARTGASQIVSTTGVISDLAIASSTTETLVAWQEGSTISGAYLGQNGSLNAGPFVIAENQKTPNSHTNLATSPDGFLAAWIEGDHAVASAVSGGAAREPVTIAVPPPPTSRSSFAITSVRIAAGTNGGLAAVDILETLNCEVRPCGTQNYVGLARFGDSAGTSVVELVDDRGRTPDVGTDGQDFLVVWSSADGIRKRFLPADGRTVDWLLFARPSWRPNLEWNGRGYTGTWGYYSFGGIPQPTVAEITNDGELTGLTRIAHASVAPYPESLAISGGEPVAVWIDQIQGTVGEFARDMRMAAPPPSPPVVAIDRCCGGRLAVHWSTSGANAVWIEIVSSDPKKNRVFTDRAEKEEATYQLQQGDVSIRVRALNAGGGSALVELAIPPWRPRAVRR